MDELLLRKLNFSDKKYFAEWWRDEELLRLTSGILDKISDDEVEEYFSAILNSTDDYHFMIDVGDKTVGHLSLSKRENDWYETQIIIGNKEYRGMGYGSEAINQLIEKAQDLSISRIYLEVRPDNLRAIKAYEKCGFQKKGIIHYPENKNQPETMRMELVNNTIIE